MTNRNETWPQGSQPGDAPISVVVVPIPQEELDLAALRGRLRAAHVSAPVPAANLPAVVADILELLEAQF